MALTEITLEGICAYMAWLPGFMRGKDSERIEFLLNLVLEQKEEIEGLESAVDTLHELYAGPDI